MAKMRLTRWVFTTIIVMGLFAIPLNAQAEKTLQIGGSFSLTGAYAEDMTAVMNAYQDYVKYVNETKRMAPWRDEKWPADITLELTWRDDELKPAKAVTIYEELKAKGMLVHRVSGSPQGLAMKTMLMADKMGTTGSLTNPVLMTPPGTIFTYYPVFTDDLAAIADWFKENWKEKRKPRVAYLTADNAMGRMAEEPELKKYLEQIGYEFVGIQYVPLVVVSPPTSQLLWLKKKNVDLALGIMVNPGAQPTVKEMVRLGMGPHLDYKITFGVGAPGHAAIFAPAMGELGDGYVCAGSFPDADDPSPGRKFIGELQKKYRSNKSVGNIMYVGGIIEAMTQAEALRLALQKVPFEKLTPRDVLEHGFYQIKNLDTGDLSSTPLTYAPDKIEGVDKVRVDQVQKGKVVKLGVWPCRHMYKH